MPFPVSPNPGDSYTDAYGTVWIYAGSVNGWYRQQVSTPNDTSYTSAISGPAGSNTQVQFNDNGTLAGDSGLTFNKTTNALSGGAFIPTSSTAPTNGLYLPSANSVALSTNGNGRLFIDSSGKLGIGTASPGTALDVRGTSGSVLNIQGSGIAGNSIIATFKTGSNGRGLEVSGNFTTEDWSITNFYNSALSFGTNNTERLRITSTGQLSHIGAGSSGSPAVSFSGSAASNSLVVDSSSRVGIGTSSPQVALQVGGTTAASQVRIYGGSAGSTYPELQLYAASSDHNWTIRGNHATNLTIGKGTFGNYGSDLLTLTAGGSVGIGTTTPRGLTSISNNAVGSVVDSSLHFGYSTADFYGFRITNSNDPAATSAGLLKFQRGTTSAWSDALVIDNSGRVGIGDTGPDSTLTIKAAASTTPLRVSGPSSEFLRCDSSGRLLVGTSSNSGGALLQVNGDRIRVATAKTPASATDTGTAGEICWDANYIYVCTATNTWKRTAIATW